MTPDDLARIEARAAAATEGPWDALFGGPDLGPHSWWMSYDDPERDGSTFDWPQITADAEFVNNARTDVPALVAALREAWAERDAYRLAVRDKQRDHEATHREKRDLTSIVVRLRTERDDARAALARVTALCDAVRLVGVLPANAIRAAIAGPTSTEGNDHE